MIIRYSFSPKSDKKREMLDFSVMEGKILCCAPFPKGCYAIDKRFGKLTTTLRERARSG